jgi:hypothetical protein
MQTLSYHIWSNLRYWSCRYFKIYHGWRWSLILLIVNISLQINHIKLQHHSGDTLYIIFHIYYGTYSSNIDNYIKCGTTIFASNTCSRTGVIWRRNLMMVMLVETHSSVHQTLENGVQSVWKVTRNNKTSIYQEHIGMLRYVELHYVFNRSKW